MSGLVLAAIAIVIPIAESGVNDDWSYSKVALDLAQTGHLRYNGWSAAMLGAQAYWGALVIKLFGFSFLALRLSVAPLAAGCAALLYVLYRRARLPPGLALFGALSIVLSPLFIPNAASFMTDVPALFLLLASAYGYVRAADLLDAAETSSALSASWWNHFCGWLLFGLLAGLLGGTVRQTGWLMPLLAPAYLLMRRGMFRRLRPAAVPLLLSWLVALGSTIGLFAWFNAQPYLVHEDISDAVVRLFTEANVTTRLCSRLLLMMQTLGIVICPLLITLPMLYGRWAVTQPRRRLRLGVALALTALVWVLAWLGNGRKWVFDWLGNTIVLVPYLSGTAPVPPGSVPSTLPVTFWQVFSLIVTLLLCAGCALAVVVCVWPKGSVQNSPQRTAPISLTRKRLRPPSHDKAATRAVAEDIPAVVGLWGVFSAAYVPLLLLKMLMPFDQDMWDRVLVADAATDDGLLLVGLLALDRSQSSSVGLLVVGCGVCLLRRSATA